MSDETERQLKPVYSDDVREQIHAQVDSLLNSIEYYYRNFELQARGEIDPSFAKELCVRLPRRIVQQGSNILSGLLGDHIRMAAASGVVTLPLGIRHLLISRLYLFRALLDGPHEAMVPGLPLDAIIEELESLCYGDEPQIFAPAPRKQGQHPRPSKIAYRRIDALRIDAFLAARGHPPSSRQSKITKAFCESWDTIRKWRKSCENVLGREVVTEALLFAVDDWSWPNEFTGSDDDIERYGAQYREERKRQRK